MSRIKCSVVDVYVFRRFGLNVEFLLLKRQPQSVIGGTWQCVHGGIEPDEPVWRAGLRELREETGLAPLRYWQLENVNTFYMRKEDAVLMCPGFVAEVAADAEVVLSDEHVAYRWAAPEDALATVIWPGQRTAIRETLDCILAPGATAEPFLRIPLDLQRELG